MGGVFCRIPAWVPTGLLPSFACDTIRCVLSIGTYVLRTSLDATFGGCRSCCHRTVLLLTPFFSHWASHTAAYRDRIMWNARTHTCCAVVCRLCCSLNAVQVPGTVCTVHTSRSTYIQTCHGPPPTLVHPTVLYCNCTVLYEVRSAFCTLVCTGY